ncbi:unnamed protein product [Pieris macdunnoughi]|uniref:Uncharacterized protein n=1 Tax=Pieris macdunnoughi TaxID=345717 RepID=A0A821U474_9NEOP|nr:unnamed protein product [Pieris macdunnoughi]
MSQAPQQGFVAEKAQELNRRTSHDDKRPDRDAQNDKDKADKQEAPRESKNPFSPNIYRGRTASHFEMGPRGLDYSPHRMGLEFSNRLRDYVPQRSSSIQGHELTDAPMKPEYLGHRNHFGSQIVPGGIHPDVVYRQDYYGQVGFPARTSRFSSQEYLNAPAQYGRWPEYRVDYRQRRRSQQDLHSIEHSPESGMNEINSHDFLLLQIELNTFLM